MSAALLAALMLGCSSADDTLPSAGDEASSPADASSLPPGSDDPVDSEAGDGATDQTVPDEGPEGGEPADDSGDEGSDGDEPAPSTTTPDDDDVDPDEEAGGDTSDDDVDPAVIALSFLGFGILVGVAAMWMLRRNDPDAQVGREERHDWPDQEMSL